MECIIKWLTYGFIAALHLPDDGLSLVSLLSRAFQARDIDLSFITPLIAISKVRLRQLKDKGANEFQSEVKDISRR